MPARSPHSFWSPLFTVCAGILLVIAIGLQPTIAALIDHYTKQPIALRRPLDEFDASTAVSFRYLPTDDAVGLIADDESLGTSDWIHYSFRSLAEPNAGPVGLFVTYYSDPRDNVPHTPEVCYRQGGATVEAIETVEIEIGLAPEQSTVEARLLDIDLGNYRVTVLYVICCNGKMFSGREGARWTIMMPGDTHVYFSKVETIAIWAPGEDRQRSIDRCKQMMKETLPVLVAEHYPRDEDVRRR